MWQRRKQVVLIKERTVRLLFVPKIPLNVTKHVEKKHNSVGDPATSLFPKRLKSSDTNRQTI